uniref:glycerophosphodiester phosphodiesterase n=1 Tax=Opuntia streptacantha TaxID=393608 RepID=A0A7C9EZT3_OPUST
MALKTIHASDVPNLDHIPENAALFSTARFPTTGVEEGRGRKGQGNANADKWGKFMVIGHRGSGVNNLQSSDRRMKSIKENSILAFNHAAQLHLHYIEFDVQVTKDDCPIIFHDIHVLTKNEGAFIEKRVTEMTLEEFLSYGPQRESGKVGKPMFRKAKDGSTYEWRVENDDPLCTLEDIFQKVDRSMGFNIEMKFDDNKIYEESELERIVQVTLKVVNKYADGRPIIFSSFQPDAAQLIRKLQDNFPVFFLTNGGCEMYSDPRRNSLDEAVKLCLEGGLDGIVSQVRAIFRNPTMVPKIKESKLSLLTYGPLNNVPEAVYMQHLMGIEGVIVDFVQEIKEAVSDFISTSNEGADEEHSSDGEGKGEKRGRLAVKFSDNELSFLLKLIPELIQP